MIKVVINSDYGGFGLSDAAIREVARRKGLELTGYDKSFALGVCIYTDQFGDEFYDRNLDRDDPDLIAVVEEMGASANGLCAELVVVEVPDDVSWHIEEYAGMEWVAETHRTWGAG